MEALSPRQRELRVLLVLSALLISITFLLFVFDFSIPIMLSFGFAYALNPSVRYLKKRGIPRYVTALGYLVLLTVLLVVFIGFLVPALLDEFRKFSEQFPVFFSTIVERISEAAKAYGLDIPISKHEITERIQGYLSDISYKKLQPLGSLAKNIFSGAGTVFSVVFQVIVIPLFFFFFLKDFAKIKRFFTELVPLQDRPRMKDKLNRIDHVMAGFIRGQLIISIIMAVVFSLGLTLLGIQFGFFIGIVSGLLNFIPYLGQWIGVGLSMTMALVDFSGWVPVIGVAALFAATNFVEGWFLSPKIVGDRVGLSPVWTIIALIVGAELGGFKGVLISIPLGGVLKILIGDYIALYKSSDPFLK